MELRQLRYFVTVVEEKNISKAAKRLHLSQPPLSIQLKNLEQELGCVLFERGAREIELTEAGLLLYNRALSLLELSAITAQEVCDLKNKTAGTLRLGVVSSVGSTLLNNWILSLHETCPDIRYEIFEGNTYEQLEQLKNHTIELAIVRSPFPETGLKTLPLKTEPMMAVGKKCFFPDNDTETVFLSTLAAAPLILYRRWEELLLSIFYEEGLSFQIFCKNDDARTTLHWADAGLGIGIVPASAISLIQSEDTVCKKIADTRLSSRICLVCNENHYLSAIARIFVEYLTNSCFPN